MESTNWFGLLTLMVTATVTGAVWPTPTVTPAAAADGVMTVMALLVVDFTVAVAPLKVTRTGATKPPPRIVTVSPPLGLPTLGLTDETKKVAAGPMRTLAAPEKPEKVAVTAAVPVSARAKRVAAARPLTSCRSATLVPFRLPKAPSVVVTWTTEPSVGTWPSERTTFTTMLLEPPLPAVISEGLAVTVTVKLTLGGGGLGVCVPPPPPLGSVGEEVQPRATRKARAKNSRGAFLNASILKLLPGSLPDFNRKGGRRGGDLIARKRPAKESHRNVQDDHRGPGLAVDAEVAKVQERLAQDLVAEQDRQVEDVLRAIDRHLAEDRLNGRRRYPGTGIAAPVGDLVGAQLDGLQVAGRAGGILRDVAQGHAVDLERSGGPQRNADGKTVEVGHRQEDRALAAVGSRPASGEGQRHGQRDQGPKDEAMVLHGKALAPGSFSNLDDSRRDKNQELVVDFAPRLVLEQVPDDGKVAQTGHAALAVVAGDLVDAADDRRAAVADHQTGMGVLGGDRSVGGAGDQEGSLRLALRDVDLQQHRALGGHLRQDVETQGGVDELHGHRVVEHRLHRNLQAALDGGDGVVERRHLRRREDGDQ